MCCQWIPPELYSIFNDCIISPFLKFSSYHLVLEAFLSIWVLWLIFRKRNNPAELVHLSEKEKEKLIYDWIPEPLAEEPFSDHSSLKPYIINGKAGKYIEVDGFQCLNFATHNYLGFIGDPVIEEEAKKSVFKYGVGSCGPRGFYGTVDVHLELEERLACFMEMEEAVLYSYGFSAIASAIPAYAKRGDLIFVDEKVNFAIQKGLHASRSQVKYFKHNDMDSLEKLITRQVELDRKNPKKAERTRRFIIVEGIYINTGEICPLPALIQLCKKYKLRIFLDESVSFGTLGKCGRGVTEYYNVPRIDVDLIIGSLECALGSIGGFCVGSSFIVEHQRLSGLGYCFSASLPPLLTSAGIAALDALEKNPGTIHRLSQNCQLVHRALSLSVVILSALNLQGDPDSPIKLLVLKQNYMSQQLAILHQIVDHCIQNGVVVITASFLEEDIALREPCLRVTVNALFTEEDVSKLVLTLEKSCILIQSQYNNTALP